MTSQHAPHTLTNARLPRWLVGPAWPQERDAPVAATITIEEGRVSAIRPVAAGTAQPQPGWDLHGALVLPGFVDAHVHLDKAFTLPRIPDVQPGLLGAIDATIRDLPNWSPEDIHERGTRGMQWAWESGTVHMRTHVNWPEIGSLPMAWPVLDRIAHDWADRLRLELVCLAKLDHFSRMDDARTIARLVASTGAPALLGGFVHSSNWQEAGLRHLLLAAQERDLDVDLHVDEELEPRACGLLHTARILREIGFAGRVVCGHVCALATQPLDQALATLDEVARAPITLVSLPITNLLLQDAVTGRTPRQRGITLVKEARARGIPLLFASDNVQDPFCRVGSFDPVESFSAAVLAAQLDAPFDDWSDTLCRSDLLSRGRPDPATLTGLPADLVIFAQADSTSWPSRAAQRVILRGGIPMSPTIPAAWTSAETSAAAGLPLPA